MTPVYYIYTHRRNDDQTIFFLDKGQGLRAWASTHHNSLWRDIVAKHGYTVEVIAEGLSYKQANKQLKQFRQLHADTLINSAPDFKLRKLTSEAHKAAISAARKGKKFTAEHRANISAALTGRKLSDAHRAAISASNLGKTVSPLGRARMRAAQIKRQQKLTLLNP